MTKNRTMKNEDYFRLFVRTKKQYKAKIAQMQLAINGLSNERNNLHKINEGLLERIKSLCELIQKKDASFDKLLSMLEYMTQQANENKQVHV